MLKSAVAVSLQTLITSLLRYPTCGGGSCNAGCSRRRSADDDRYRLHQRACHQHILGDLAEIQAIRAVFQNHSSQLIVNATKSLIGHTLGASGAIGVAISALSIRDGVVHGTLNLENPEELCNFKYLGTQNQEATIRHALVNSFGFGGHNTSIVLSKV